MRLSAAMLALASRDRGSRDRAAAFDGRLPGKSTRSARRLITDKRQAPTRHSQYVATTRLGRAWREDALERSHAGACLP